MRSGFYVNCRSDPSIKLLFSFSFCANMWDVRRVTEDCFSQFTSLHQPEEDSIVWQHIHRRSVQLIRGEDKQDQRVKYGLFLHHMITCKKIIWQLVKYSLDSILFLFSGQGVIFPPVSGRDGCPAVPSVQSSKLPHVSFQLNNST